MTFHATRRAQPGRARAHGDGPPDFEARMAPAEQVMHRLRTQGVQRATARVDDDRLVEGRVVRGAQRRREVREREGREEGRDAGEQQGRRERGKTRKLPRCLARTGGLRRVLDRGHEPSFGWLTSTINDAWGRGTFPRLEKVRGGARRGRGY